MNEKKLSCSPHRQQESFFYLHSIPFIEIPFKAKDIEHPGLYPFRA